MPLSSCLCDDRFILVSLGLATAGVLYSMHRVLVQYRDASEIEPIEPKTQYITQETEDALPAATLDSLLSHYNVSIRETAAKIVCDRALHDDATMRLVLWGIAQPDYDERMKNLRALAMLTEQNSLRLLYNRHAYAALVKSLEHCVDEGPRYAMMGDLYFDECALRDMAEKLCLMFFDQLTAKFGVAELVHAGFVDRWLARQDWGDTPHARYENYRRYLNTRENRIADLCRRIGKSSTGRAALERAGLIPRKRSLRRPTPAARVRTGGGGGNCGGGDGGGGGGSGSGENDRDRDRDRGHDYDYNYADDQAHGRDSTRVITYSWSDPAVAPIAASLSRLMATPANGTPSSALAAVPAETSETFEPTTPLSPSPPLPPPTTTRIVIDANDDAYISEVRAVLAALGFADLGIDLSQVQIHHRLGAEGEYEIFLTLDRRPPQTPTHAPTQAQAEAQAQARPPNSREEQRIRRQHREAMVLNDGTRPLGRDDIIERESE